MSTATPYGSSNLNDAINSYRDAFLPGCHWDYFFGGDHPRNDARPSRITLIISFQSPWNRLYPDSKRTFIPECERNFRALGYAGARFRAITQLDAEVRRKRRAQAATCRRIDAWLMHGASA